MWKYYNPNPQKNNVGDCTVRAISKALYQSWDVTYAELAAMGFMIGDMPSANHVWGAYLRRNHFERELVPSEDIYTVNDFCRDNPKGVYVLALQGHVVCVVDGDYYDTWDSGREIPIYYWRKENGTSSNMDEDNS